MKKILKKQIYKIEFELASALSIGSGENNQTDRDIVIGSDNKPYIPASSIAGVCINAIDANKTPETRFYKNYWGYIEKAVKTDDKSHSEESRLIFHDAYLLENQKIEKSVRDSVALDECKNAIDGAKFDMEVLEPGVKFVTYIEQSFYDKGEPELAKAIAGLFKSGVILFGSKTSRGYGAISNIHIYEYTVDFENNSKENFEKLQEWTTKSIEEIEWGSEKTNLEKVTIESEIRVEKVINIALKQESGISIRRYSTDVSNRESAPDFTQIVSTYGSKEKVRPIIPGTSWAGAFEHQIKSHLGSEFDEEEWNDLFGYVKGQKKQKSKIRFSESKIENAISKQMSRSSIDRFSGGTKTKALFTEKTFYNGKTRLQIGILNTATISNRMARAIAATIVDLHFGFLAIGGETAIGRGLFSIESIDGIDFIPRREDTEKANEFYSKILELIVSIKKGGQNNE